MGRAAPGFTLVEVLVVVVIIAILAVIAVPSVVRRLKDRRTQQVAYEVSALYRDARMRAMGRGSAVLVRYEDGKFQVREAVRGTDEANDKCQKLPVSSCLSTAWESPPEATNRAIASFDAATRVGTKEVKVQLKDGDDDTPNLFDVCFTPMGRAYAREAADATLTMMTQIPVIRIWRDDGDGGAVGLTRRVFVLPNGNARLATAEGTP
jgi:type IV fimbrial biogenesis protein FimT